MEKTLLPLPAKRYFTIGEVGELCGVKPHVLRYWEQEFTQLRPMKRRGNRRYYQHHEVLMIRRIRDLLYDQGFTISGARNKLQELMHTNRDRRKPDEVLSDAVEMLSVGHDDQPIGVDQAATVNVLPETASTTDASALRHLQQLRRELFEIRALLTV